MNVTALEQTRREWGEVASNIVLLRQIHLGAAARPSVLDGWRISKMGEALPIFLKARPGTDALPVDMDQGLETLFVLLDALPDPVDAGVPLRETPVESQLRLLEERAPYRFDAPESSERASRATEGE